MIYAFARFYNFISSQTTRTNFLLKPHDVELTAATKYSYIEIVKNSKSNKFDYSKDLMKGGGRGVKKYQK